MDRRNKLVRGELELIDRLARSTQLVYSPSQLAELFYAMREQKIYAKQTSYEDFLAFVLRRNHLTQIELRAPHYDDTILRFCRGQAAPLDIAGSLKRSAYFTHSTAAYLNGLMSVLPANLFLNQEQSAKPKPDGASLSQATLDRAFAGTQRQSKLFYTHENLTVTMLSGKKTGKRGVEQITAPNGRTFPTTNLERTLVDITVRPAYAGGIKSVLACFQAAQARVSIDHLMETLDQLDYLYPYAQAIGFLGQRAGFSDAQMNSLRERITPLKFYLEHAMTNPRYDESWKVYYPADL